MFLSVFDIFKIGIGPSSSHTMGPMVAAARFLDIMRASPFHFGGVKARLHGSLAFTGVGHGTDRATILGLAGFAPQTYVHDHADVVLAEIRDTHRITVFGLPVLKFDPKNDIKFDFGPNLPKHANGMVLMATDNQGDVVLQETYYSLGGGFVLSEAEMDVPTPETSLRRVPYPFKTAREMLHMAETSGKSISQMKRENELSQIEHHTLSSGLARIWQVMSDCIDRGLERDGFLPGGLLCAASRQVYL